MTSKPAGAKAAPARHLVTVYTSEAVHTALREEAMRLDVGMGPLLVGLFLETLPERKRTALRSTLPRQIPVHEGRMRTRKQRGDSGLPMCTECLRRHVNLPGPGPWHERECTQWRLRAALF